MPPPFWIRDLGTRGEYLVRRLFHRRGYHCVARNWRHHKGEIDLIMANYRRLLFLEVKTRSYRRGMRIGDQLKYRQKRRLQNLARSYLSQWQCQDLPWKFHLVLVTRHGKRRFHFKIADL